MYNLQVSHSDSQIEHTIVPSIWMKNRTLQHFNKEKEYVEKTGNTNDEVMLAAHFH